MSLRAFAQDMRQRYRDEIVEVMQDLIRIPSQNTPPTGEEGACQEFIASYLARHGSTADLYEPDKAAGLVEHPDYWPGRDYRNRPNLSAILKGKGGGRSLLLTGHCDTVALGENVWARPPFAAEIHDGRLYGLGAVDMKGPLGAMLVLFKALAEQGTRLGGSLTFESVVDEEEAGVNGTIAGRLREGPVDGAVIGEVTGLEIYPAARGALIANVIFGSERSWLDVGRSAAKAPDAVEQISIFLAHVDALRAIRRSHSVPDLYKRYPDPTSVSVTKVYAGGWGSQVPIAVPAVGRIELICQTLPGEDRASVLRDVEDWLDSLVERHPAAFPARPQIQFARRWMHPTAMDPSHPLVTILGDSLAQVTGQTPTVVGAPYPCDLWALQRSFKIPSVVFGPSGGNAHAADEYVDLESVFAMWEALLMFTCRWCGVDGDL